MTQIALGKELPLISPRTIPPRHHREPGNDEDRGRAAEAGYLINNR